MPLTSEKTNPGFRAPVGSGSGESTGTAIEISGAGDAAAEAAEAMAEAIENADRQSGEWGAVD